MALCWLSCARDNSPSRRSGDPSSNFVATEFEARTGRTGEFCHVLWDIAKSKSDIMCTDRRDGYIFRGLQNKRDEMSCRRTISEEGPPSRPISFAMPSLLKLQKGPMISPHEYWPVAVR